MPVHGVLVERNEQVNPVAHIGDRLRPGANRQQRMSAANNGLIGVVGIQAEPPPAEDFGEDVTRRGHTLARRATNGDRKGLFHGTLLAWELDWKPAATVLHKLRALLEGKAGFPRKTYCMGISHCSSRSGSIHPIPSSDTP